MAEYSGARRVTFVPTEMGIENSESIAEGGIDNDNCVWMERSDMPPKLIKALERLARQVRQAECSIGGIVYDSKSNSPV